MRSLVRISHLRGNNCLYCSRDGQRSLRSYLLASLAVLAVLTLLAFGFSGVPGSSSVSSGRNDVDRLVIIGVTRYDSTGDVRFLEAMRSVRTAREHGWRFVIVDSSPDAGVKDHLTAAGAHVIRQRSHGAKGAALRDGIREALDLLGDDEGVIAYQEVEKSDMPRHWGRVLKEMDAARARIAVPWRIDHEFRATYPIEQYHSESFAGHILNQYASEHNPRWVDIDIFFGPFAVRRTVAPYFLESRGDMWTAQILPMIRAIRDGQKCISVDVPFRAAASMKAQEEGKLRWVEKRYMQLTLLVPAIKAALRGESVSEKTSDGG